MSDREAVDSLSAKPLSNGLSRANTRGTGSSFHGRSRRRERQSIPGGGVSNCPISKGEGCVAPIE